MADATVRGIGDNGRLRVCNDVLEPYLCVKLSPAIAPGTVLIYHAWERFWFACWRSVEQIHAPPAKPIHRNGNVAVTMLGGSGHLGYRYSPAATSPLARGIRVDVEGASLI